MTSTKADNRKWKAYDTFPVLVWKNVFLYLHKQSDRDNLVNSSDNFKDFLDKYPEFKFNISMIFPQIECYLDMTSFWACRRVCRYWKELFDNHSDSKQLKTYSLHQYLEHYARKTRLTYSSVASFQEGKAHAKTSICPSVCRQIFFNPDSSEDKNDYYSHGIEHLSTVGKHVWHLKIGFEACTSSIQKDHNPIRYLKFVCQCLKHVPNIKSLWLDMRCCESLAEEENKLLEEYLTLFKFPQLENLTWIRLEPCSCHMSIGKLFQTYQNQLENIEVKSCEWEYHQEASLPKIRSAWLTFSENSGAALKLMKTNNWRVTELVLRVEASYRMETCRDNLIEIFRHLSNTLDFLQIELETYPPRGATCFRLMCEDDLLDESVFESVTISKLKKFDILHSTITSWDFLASFCPSLEHLVVREERLRVDLELPNGGRLMPNVDDSAFDYESDIWDQNPKLKTIAVFQATCCCKPMTYSRHGYENLVIA